MLITLAWLSIQASMTLAAILTVILLPWALLKARRSPTLVGVTLVMLGMTWRGEAWKAGCLSAEAQLSQSSQQSRQSLPKTAFSGRGSDSPDAVRRFAFLEHATVSRLAEDLSGQERPETPWGDEQYLETRPQSTDETRPARHLACPEAFLVLYPQMRPKTELHLPQDDQITPDAELPYRIGGNTSGLYMTYIV
jgi:hypothetical protein